MGWVILDGFKNYDLNSKAKNLKKVMERQGIDYKYFRLEDMDISPCRSCESCAFKTPGRCVVDDDMPDIIRSIASCSGIILFTPIVFGGYSSQLKKAVDKFLLLGLPLYEVRDGHLLHPMRYGYKPLIGIGVTRKNNPEAEENFKLLIERNALNMQCPHHKTLVLYSEEDKEVEHKISGMFEEVSKW